MNSINTDNFWRNKVTWRTTGKGMNKYVIKQFAPYVSKDKAINYMRQNIIPYHDRRKYILDDNDCNKYFRDVVNDCLHKVWHKERGFIFTEDQLREVMRIIPDVDVKYDENYARYYCWIVR